MAQERMHRFCRASNKHFTFATVKRTVALPVFWMFIIFYPACVIGNQAYNCENPLPCDQIVESLMNQTLDCTLSPWWTPMERKCGARAPSTRFRSVD